MRMKISQKQFQRQILAPTMQQSIEVLMLPLLDLNLAIEQELQNNPLLEMSQETPSSSSEIDKEILRQIENLQKTRELPYSGKPGDDEMPDNQPIKREVSLEETLLKQLRIELSDPLKIKIAEIIISDLDEDGYLKLPVEEIAKLTGTDDIALVENILNIIQNSEPIGLASRNLKECLTIQIKSKKDDNLPCAKELILKVLENSLNDLANKRYQMIAKKLAIPLDVVKKISQTIATLEPKPARNFRPISSNIYIKPDVSILKDEDDELHIRMNQEGVPRLRINATYKKMLTKENLTKEEKEFIREKLKNAIHFIKSIDQRGQTIERISKYVLDKQKNFFRDGQAALVPMTLKDVAKVLERNESTISRAISNKYIDTPYGLFPIKFFFAQGFNENTQGAVSSRSIKEDIKELIESEDKTSPLSDHDIEKHFGQKGMSIARRTISKYRQALHILPSHLRKE